MVRLSLTLVPSFSFQYLSTTMLTLSDDMVKESRFPGSLFPLYSATTPAQKMLRRPVHDSFRPPYGPAIPYLTSIGYSKEVGLPDGMQELYDPCTQESFFLDHSKSELIVEDFRPKPEMQAALHPVLFLLAMVLIRICPPISTHRLQ